MLLTSSTVHHSEQTPATHEISLSVATSQSHAFHIQGETERCDDLIRTANHVFVGISPFNSRFSKEYVTALVQWTWNHFSTVDILLPSEEDAARLLVASGTPITKALKKTRREIRRHLRNLDEILASFVEPGRTTRVIQFADYQDNSAYQQARTKVEQAYADSLAFKMACLNMSRQAIGSRVKATGGNPEAISNADIQTALPYIFSELPFYLDTPSILEVESSTLIYHRPWPIGEGLFAGHFPLSVSHKQSYGVVTPAPHTTF